MEETWKSQFREWLKEIYPDGELWSYVIRRPKPSFDYAIERDVIELAFFVFTHTYRYCISVSKDYLKCTVSCRKPRAGEDWNRENDLPGGKFCRETWELIKNAIIRYELVKVAKHSRSVMESDLLPKAEASEK